MAYPRWTYAWGGFLAAGLAGFAPVFIPVFRHREERSNDEIKTKRPRREPGPLILVRQIWLLLNRLAVQRQIEAVAFDLFGHAQSDRQIDDLQDDQRHDDVISEDDADADALIEHLAPIALKGACGVAVSFDRKDTGEYGAGRAADAVHAESVERVIVAE